MSAIGEYIHLTGKGYQESGINRPHQRPGITAAAALSVQRDIVRKKIDSFGKVAKKTIEKLQTEMNQFKDLLGEGEVDGTNIANQQELRDYLFNNLSKEIAQLYDLNWDNLSAVTTPNPVTKLSTGFYNYKDWKNRIISRVNEFNSILKQIEQQSNGNNGADTAQLQNLIQKADKLINDTYEKTYAHLNEVGYYTWRKSPTVKNMVRKLNALITEFNSLPIIDNNNNQMLKGIIDVIPQTAEVQVRKALGQIKGTNFTIETDQKSTSVNKTIDLGDLKETIISNDKGLEISFNWNSKKLNVKVNNLKIKGSQYQFVNIGTETTLGELLSEASNDFANHYYNIFTQHQDKHASLAGLRSEYNDMIKLLAIYKAFDNKQIGKDKVYIYTKNKNAEIKVISVRDILDKVIDGNTKMQSVIFNGESITKAKLLANKKEPNNLDGSIRISKVLAEAHTRKISAALNSSVITSI